MSTAFNFTSNSTAGCSNQHYFDSDPKAIHISRAYFRIDAGGEYNYSLLFTGVHDSSYRRLSMANQRCDSWEILGARVSKCEKFPSGISTEELDPSRDLCHTEFTSLTFNGQPGIKAKPTFFSSDPIKLQFDCGEYLCLEMTYRGERIPCHPEVIIPVYTMEDNNWRYTVNMPLPAAIGCDRSVKGSIAYIGDSITQGVGTPINEYLHWNARLSEMIGFDYSHWNLGIGYGKASDAATDSIWLEKAKMCDTVFVCFGVNDINGDYTSESIKSSLKSIVRRLVESGCRVILQTVPPYDYQEPRLTVWNEVNRYIKCELSGLCDKVFDVSPVLSLSDAEPQMAKYDGHPNSEGCAIWAKALYEAVKDMF